MCALVYVDPRTPCAERVFEARCEGRLAAEPRGAGGFGYDPGFLPDDDPPDDGDDRDDGPPARERPPASERPPTMAELSDAQKDAISHRGRAARALLEWLGSEGPTDPKIG